jgi:hypothetical protein
MPCPTDKASRVTVWADHNQDGDIHKHEWELKEGAKEDL